MKIKINNEVSQNVQDIELGSISLANIIDLIRPIGSLYWSENSTNPSTIYPGTTWVQITDKFIVAAGSTYKVGSSYGAASHTHTSAAHTHTTGNHTLTVAEMPSHTHIQNSHKHNIPYRNDGGPYDISIYFSYTGGNVKTWWNDTVSTDTTTATNQNTGGGGAHNHGNTGSTTPGNTGSSSNIPPSVAMYCWKRTA